MSTWESLAALTAEDREALSAKGEILEFSPRKTLLAEVPLRGLVVVLEGHVHCRLSIRDGAGVASVDDRVAGPGDLVGEVSVFASHPTTATLTGVSAGRLLLVPSASIDELTRTSVPFSARLYASLASFIARRLEDTLRKQPSMSVEEVAQVRYHHALLSGHRSESSVPEALGAAISQFKQQMLALDQMLASTRGAVARGKQSAAAEAELVSRATVQVAQHCDDLMTALREAVASARTPAEAEAWGAHTLRETFSLFMQSRLCDRSFSKPRGYAGDFYTIELIQENRPAGDGRLGPLIDAWYLGIPSARAVRSRRKLLTGLFADRFRSHGTGQDDRFRVLSLGSGAARELFDLFSVIADPGPAYATCLDVDAEALAFGQRLTAEASLAERFVWSRENILHLARKLGHTHPESQDIVYSSGLFDYLSDEVAARVLDWVYEQLEPGAVAVIGNFDVACPDRAFLDHILDWKLLYRSPDDMTAIIRRSAFGDAPVSVHWEENHVNFFACVERPR